MKTKVCIIAVCYNAHNDAKNLLESIALASDNEKEQLELFVVLSDNSTSVPPADLVNAKFKFNYTFIKNDNIGYFPAFLRGVRSLNIDIKEFDYIAVSNVDLQVDRSFFKSLNALQVAKDVGVIAPSILSMSNGRDLNPKMRVRPSVRKIKFARSLFEFPLLFNVYNLLTRIKEYVASKRQQQSDNATVSLGKSFYEMYGAHGSFIIFTKQYFLAGASIEYPRFLFGEEGFVAEQARAKSLKIVHVPQIIIHDREHGTTSQQPSSFMCREHVKSYDYYLNTFRKDEL